MSTAEDQPSWSLEEYWSTLSTQDQDELVGRDRLGELAFTDAPEIVNRIRDAMADIRGDDWGAIPLPVRQQLEQAAGQLIDLLEQMKTKTSREPSAAAEVESIRSSLVGIRDIFLTARPYAVGGRIKRELRGMPADTAELEARIQDAEARVVDVVRKLEALEPLAEVGRETATVSGAAELATFYEASAVAHNKSWRAALKWLTGAFVVALGGSILTVWIAHPSKNATNAQIASRILIDLLVIGLLLYAVRLASLQFRVHRHLEAVDRNKAAALKTFNRIVAGPSESDVRTAIAVTLAEAVFTSGETGFIDAGADHITLIERVVGPAMQKLG